MEQMIQAKVLYAKKKKIGGKKTTLMQAEIVLVVYKQGNTRTRDTAKKIKESCLHNVRPPQQRTVCQQKQKHPRLYCGAMPCCKVGLG